MSSKKNNIEIMIGGKSLTVSGDESKEHLMQIATYLEHKVVEFSKTRSYAQQSIELRNVLMQINIADDYFKAKKLVEHSEYEMAKKEKEVYDLRHEIVSLQMKLEKSQADTAKVKQELKKVKTELKMLDSSIANMITQSDEQTNKDDKAVD